MSPIDPVRMGEISLVVPIRNEVESLSVLIDSIRRQSRQPDEVLLVDGGSDDGTARLARELIGDDASYRLVEAGNATPGRGRNVGIEGALHDWIALTDAGIELECDWLARLEAAAIADPSAGVVWGSYEPRVSSFLDDCAAVACVAARRPTPHGPVRGPFVASCLLRRGVWREVGGFPDLRAAEDLIFMEKIERSSVRATWAPDAVAVWSLPPTLGRLFQRFRSYSRHNVVARRQADWHYGVARLYVGAAAISLAAVFVDRRIIRLLGAGAAARTGKSLLAHREGRSLGWVLNPFRFLGVTVVLGVVDTATFVGWAEALLARRPPPAQDGP